MSLTIDSRFSLNWKRTLRFFALRSQGTLFLMNINKLKMHNRRTHGHLDDVMKIATVQNLSPNMDKLVKVKRCLASTSKM